MPEVLNSAGDTMGISEARERDPKSSANSAWLWPSSWHRAVEGNTKR
jgi:hypothetical protein